MIKHRLADRISFENTMCPFSIFNVKITGATEVSVLTEGPLAGETAGAYNAIEGGRARGDGAPSLHMHLKSLRIDKFESAHITVEEFCVGRVLGRFVRFDYT